MEALDDLRLGNKSQPGAHSGAETHAGRRVAPERVTVNGHRE